MENKIKSSRLFEKLSALAYAEARKCEDKNLSAVLYSKGADLKEIAEKLRDEVKAEAIAAVTKIVGS